MEHLRAVFEMLRKERLVVNKKKSEFFMEEIHFLGHIVSKDGVRMDPAKIKSIQDRPEPVNLHEVRSFLGLCSYYRIFIRFFAEIAAPLHDLMRKGMVFRFGERQRQAFKLLKEKLTTEPVLILPDLGKSFQVQCDAGGSSIGAVLMQDGHVIAYESRVLRGPEKHMQIYEKELLAVIYALGSWKHYLLGADFIVQTDHQSLRYFLTQAKLSEKHLSWANFLSMFHFQLVHVAGKKNVVADALSRRSHVAVVSIAYQHELDEMRDYYSTDEDFAEPYDTFVRGEHPDSYSLKNAIEGDYGKDLAVILPLGHASTLVLQFYNGICDMGIESKVRTSTSMFLTAAERKYPMIEAIEKRISIYSMVPVENGELLQILRYEQGQFYRPHHDYFADEFSIQRGGQRVATFLMYLTEGMLGGETYFPWVGDNTCSCGGEEKRGTCIEPRQGDALLFWSQKLDGTVDSATSHGSCTVLEGEKWSATKWLRQKEFS
ncbi:hypothetical protein L7F22_020278 [Adiantum nelumboides]|nr:hypothetical protein [Adiantum nelumboides]